MYVQLILVASCLLLDGITCSEVGNVSEWYANAIIATHGGSNGVLSVSNFQSYLDHLQNLSRRDLILDSSSTPSAIIHSTFDCAEETSPPTSFCVLAKSQCFSAQQLLNLVGDGAGSVDARTLLTLCPLVLQQLENNNCSFNDREPQPLASSNNKPTPAEVWSYGFLFVSIINLSAIFGAVLLPLMGKKFFNRLLVTLIGLAVGSLSSSAAFHLLPQAFGLVPENGSSHGYLWISLLVIFGIYLFFMMERFLKIFIDFKKRRAQFILRRNLSDVEVLSYTSTVVNETTNKAEVGKSCEHHHDHICPQSKKEHKHDHHIEFKQGKDSAITTVAWMIVFGDGLHNFIDGLSIGAAFNESILTGISISVAVICEELPHELGDLAVLLNSGMTVKQALLYNFLSAMTCYVGLVIGILLGELAAASMYIFAIAGGVFLYISLADMTGGDPIPEMNEEVESASKSGVLEAIKVIALQNLGWLTGTAILFTLAYYSDQLSFT